MTRFAIHPDLPPDLADHFREHHARLFDEAVPLSTSRDQVTRSFSYEGSDYIIKRYSEKGPRRWLQAFFGRTRALNAFRRARELAAAEIKTPGHLFVARHLGFFQADSFLIMEKSPGEQLFAMIFDRPKRPISNPILHNVATLTKQMHQAGLTHGDLHSRNLLVLPDHSVEIIDLDGMDHRRSRQKKDRLRLIHSFRGRPGLRRRLARLLTTSR
jgi:tRNA A-37 threonylcarbamoyl transferase component Bud32